MHQQVHPNWHATPTCACHAWPRKSNCHCKAPRHWSSFKNHATCLPVVPLTRACVGQLCDWCCSDSADVSCMLKQHVHTQAACATHNTKLKACQTRSALPRNMLRHSAQLTVKLSMQSITPASCTHRHASHQQPPTPTDTPPSPPLPNPFKPQQYTMLCNCATAGVLSAGQLDTSQEHTSCTTAVIRDLSGHAFHCHMSPQLHTEATQLLTSST